MERPLNPNACNALADASPHSASSGVLIASTNPAFESRLSQALLTREITPAILSRWDETRLPLLIPPQAILFVDIDTAEELGRKLLLCGKSQDVSPWYIAVTRHNDPKHWRALLDAGFHDLLLDAPDFPGLETRLAVARSHTAVDAAPLPRNPNWHIADGRRFRAIFDCTSLAIAVAETSGRLIDCNPHFAALLGYTVDEILEKTLQELTYPEDLQVDRERIRRFLRGERRTITTEKRYLRRDGGVIWGRVSGSMIHNGRGEPAYMIGTIEDISGRKLAEQARSQAELALREREMQYRFLAENASDIVWTIALDHPFAPGVRLNAILARKTALELLDHGTFLYVSPSVERVLGYRPAESLLKRPCELLSDAGGEALVDLLTEVLLRDQAGRRSAVRYRTIQTDVLTKQGTPLPCELTISLLRDEQGRVTGVAGSTRDITERRNAEAALLKEQELLRRMLDLSEQERALLAFEIHDGFAQMLTGSLLQFEASVRLAGTLPDPALRAAQAGIRLLRESILESRRLVSGLHPPVLDSFGVVPAIEMLTLESPEPNSPKVELITGAKFDRLSRNLENAVFRIVQESLTNARRHSRSEKIRVELSQDAQWVRIGVRDWGVGFDPENVDPRRFGLRGIRERARLMQGRATIKSAPGRGTTVCVELPVIRRPPEEIEPNVLEDVDGS